jgi:hypothetical protein
MSVRRFALAVVVATAAFGTWAQDRVVCRFDDAAAQAYEGLRNMREPVDADPGPKITAVAQFEP